MTTRLPGQDERLAKSLASLKDALPVPEMDDALVGRVVLLLTAKKQSGGDCPPLAWFLLCLIAACAMAAILLELIGAAGLPLGPLAQALLAAAQVVSSLPSTLPYSLPLLLAGAALADAALILLLIRRPRRQTPWPSV